MNKSTATLASTICRKKDGFSGERSIVLSKKTMELCKSTPLIESLFVTDIGFYPKAQYHYRERTSGAAQFIIKYCVSGRGGATFNGERYTVNAGEFLLVPIDTPHKYWADEEKPWSVYWFHFTGTLAAHYAQLLTNGFKDYVRPIAFSEERTRLFNELFAAYENPEDIQKLQYGSMILGHYLSTFIFASQDTPSVKKEENTDAVTIALNYMNENIHRILSLEDIASQLHVSSPHFSALFRKKMGYSPMEYFSNLKIQKACEFLKNTSLRINEVSFKLGIEDPYYFSRLFSRKMGVPPLEYRRATA